MRRTFSLLLGAVMVTSSAAAQTSAGKPTPEEAPSIMTAEARRRFDEGARALSSGDFEKARVAFLETFALNQSPEVLRNLAIAEVPSGHRVSGARHLAAYLHGQHAAAETPGERAFNDRTFTALSAQLGRLSVQADVSGADVTVDDEAVGRTPLSELFLDPGEHSLVVKAGGMQRAQTVSVNAGQSVQIQVTLNSTPSATPIATPSPTAPAGSEPPPPIEASSAPAWPLYVGGGLTVAGLAAGLAFTLSANGKQSDAEALRIAGGSTQCGAGTRFAADCARLHQANADVASARDRATAAWIFAGAAGALTATYWLTIYSSHGSSTSTVRAGAMLAPGNAIATLAGSF